MSMAATLLDTLTRQGVRLKAKGGELLYRPPERMTPDLKARLREHKQELLSLLKAKRELAMSLDVFEQEGLSMEIAVAWFEKTLWFVPTRAEAEILTKEGISRGVIWTARELIDLLAIPSLTKEHVKQIATAKAIFQGTVEERTE